MAVAVSACEFSASTASITSADLARGYADGKATDVSTTFAPSDTPLHYVVTLGSAPDGLDERRREAGEMLRALAGRIAELAPLDTTRSLPLGFAATAVRTA